eukprot:45947_5
MCSRQYVPLREPPVLTSRRPDATNWGDGYWRKTAGNWSTLPEVFRRSGYQTQGMGKIFRTLICLAII